MNDIASLNKELARLKSEKAALQAQSKLLEDFVALAHAPAKEQMLTVILQKTLDISARLTGAQKGSLFLLNDRGAVTDSILTRSGASPEQRTRLIGRVLDQGLAGWVRRHRKVGLIEDTANDARWLNLDDQPYTVGSALAVPILRGSHLLGLLTLLHAEPGHFNTEAAELMQLTAAQIGSAIENARLYTRLDDSYRFLEKAKAKIEAYSNALDAEFEKGKKIQRDFLPTRLPRVTGWEIAACFHPARQVSGDFYDAFLLPGGLLGLVIADVCDKGVGSALFMALFRSLIRVFSGQISLQGVSLADSAAAGLPGEIKAATALQAVSLTNDYIAAEHGDEAMFATLFFAVLNPATGDIAYVNGGHEPAFIVGASGIKAQLNKSGPAVGMFPGSPYRIENAKIAAGDILIGYTDGVTEAHSPQKALFTKKRFLGHLQQPAASASQLIERIKADLFKHIANAPQFDDITMLAICRQA